MSKTKSNTVVPFGPTKLADLAASINAEYAQANLARVSVGRLLNQARGLIASDNAFGAWCCENLRSDISKSDTERKRLMRVSRWVDDQRIDNATVTAIGWRALADAAFACTSADMPKPEAKRATAAVIKLAARGGKVTAKDVVQTVRKVAPAYAKARDERWAARTTGGSPERVSPMPSDRCITVDVTVDGRATGLRLFVDFNEHDGHYRAVTDIDLAELRKLLAMAEKSAAAG